MRDEFVELQHQINLFLQLKYYQIVIEAYNGETVIPIIGYQFGNTSQEITLSVNEILYFTEYGTLSTSGYHLFEKLANWISQKISPVVDRIFDGIFQRNFTEDDVWLELNRFEHFMNGGALFQYLSEYISDFSFLSNLIGIPEESSEYTVLDRNVLKNYIRCKIYKK